MTNKLKSSNWRANLLYRCCMYWSHFISSREIIHMLTSPINWSKRMRAITWAYLSLFAQLSFSTFWFWRQFFCFFLRRIKRDISLLWSASYLALTLNDNRWKRTVSKIQLGTLSGAGFCIIRRCPRGYCTGPDDNISHKTDVFLNIIYFDYNMFIMNGHVI